MTWQNTYVVHVVYKDGSRFGEFSGSEAECEAYIAANRERGVRFETVCVPVLVEEEEA